MMFRSYQSIVGRWELRLELVRGFLRVSECFFRNSRACSLELKKKRDTPPPFPPFSHKKLPTQPMPDTTKPPPGATRENKIEDNPRPNQRSKRLLLLIKLLVVRAICQPPGPHVLQVLLVPGANRARAHPPPSATTAGVRTPLRAARARNKEGRVAVRPHGAGHRPSRKRRGHTAAASPRTPAAARPRRPSRRRPRRRPEAHPRRERRGGPGGGSVEPRPGGRSRRGRRVQHRQLARAVGDAAAAAAPRHVVVAGKARVGACNITLKIILCGYSFLCNQGLDTKVI